MSLPPPTQTRRRGARGPVADPGRVAAMVAVAGLVLSLAASWATAQVDANSEHRLLEWQTKQAGSVLSTAVTLLEQPLATALSVQQVAGRARDDTAFTGFIAPYVGSGKSFLSASLWRRDGQAMTRLASVGAEPGLASDTAALQAFLQRAFQSATTVVEQVTTDSGALVAWARADPGTGYAVYAERAAPAGRRAAVASDSAYGSLHYAMYIGRQTAPDALFATDVDPATLPLDGDTSRVTIPFGDTGITLVTSPQHHLGSDLSRWLPLALLLGGVLLTALAAWTTRRLLQGRREAEQDAATITTLYEQVEELYGQQRELFVRLQRALLPQATPQMAGLEIASEYVAGAFGIDIGGDWYSFVALDDHRFAFVVGDVSGRGVDAVAVMAQARFTLRAYLLEGQGPATALERCSHQFDIVADGHMSTVVAGVGDARTGEVTLANAGHPVPLLLDGGVRPVHVPPGRPLGAGPSRYEETTLRMPPGSTLFCFTDGLVERRGEDIDTGLGRLAETLLRSADRPVADLVADAVAQLRGDAADAADDVVALAIRRVGAG